MTISPSPSVFFLGITGYVGGAFLDELLKLQTPPSTITALIRSSDKVKIFENLSTESTKLIGVQGSFEDHELVEKLASESEVVVSVASADDPGSMNAALSGMKARQTRTGIQGVLIHVSGTGTIIDDARGRYKSTEIYTDLASPSSTFPHAKTIDTLPDKAFHRDVDQLVEAADDEGYVRTYTIVPGTIWGEAEGLAGSSGLSNIHSQQIPGAINLSLKRKQAGVTGKGLNVWVHVHILDTAALFGALYPLALADKASHGPPKGPHGSGYYFSASGEYCIGEAMQLIGQEMYKNGWSSTADVSELPETELKDYYGPEFYVYPGTNSRAVAENPEKVLGFRGSRGVGDRSMEWDEYVRSETRRLGTKSK